MDWQRYYWQTDDWSSKLAFYEDELQFLQNLMDRYFTDMVQCQNLDEIREQIIRFQDVKYTCHQLISEVRKHRKNLARTMDQYHAERDFIHGQHLGLSQRLKEFLEQLKVVKKELFMVAQPLLEHQKQEEMYLN